MICVAIEILIIKIGALGDVLRTTFLLTGFKGKYSDCSISWLTSKKAVELLSNNKLIDYVYTLDEKEKVPSKFDIVLCLDDEKEAALVASKIEKKEFIGAYVENDEIKYTENSADWFGMGLLRPKSDGGKEVADKLKKKNKQTYQELVAKIAGLNYNKETPILNLMKEDLEFGRKFAMKNGIKDSDYVIGLNTGAGKRWPLKKWGAENTAELSKQLNLKGIRTILLGGKDEEERNKEIIDWAENGLIDSGVDNSLREFASIINLCDILVCTDSLSLHFAIALKKKVVVLFGPTSAAEIEVYDKGIKIIADKDYLATYTRADKPDIMANIKVEDVINAIEKLRIG